MGGGEDWDLLKHRLLGLIFPDQLYFSQVTKLGPIVGWSGDHALRTLSRGAKTYTHSPGVSDLTSNILLSPKGHTVLVLVAFLMLLNFNFTSISYRKIIFKWYFSLTQKVRLTFY